MVHGAFHSYGVNRVHYLSSRGHESCGVNEVKVKVTVVKNRKGVA